MPVDIAEEQAHYARNDFLKGGGEMGKVISAKDWSKTPLGPIESWPQSLRTTVSLCLASNFPISIAWGADRIQIYNDGYWPICGAKHPHSMGQDFRECWASAWPAIGEAFESAEAGETRYLENQRMFLDRNGYMEETFFTFSFSPIRDESGGVGGLFHPVTETTAKMLSERRTRALRDLATKTAKASSVGQACDKSIEVIAGYELDLPFALLYVLDDAGQQLELLGSTGIEAGTSASPKLLGLAAIDAPWPLAEAVRADQPQSVRNFAQRLGLVSCGPYPEPPGAALLLPIPRPGLNRLTGVLVAGVSSRLPLDDNYRSFYDLVAGQLATAIANARAYEEERQRAEALAELDRAKTQFFSNVSHEFRTPLTLMLGPLEEMLGRAGASVTATRDELDLVYRNGLRLLRLVNALLDFSRIEAGRVQAVFEPVDLATLTSDFASVFRSATERAGLKLVVDCPAIVEAVYVDRSMWEKVVLNLVSNAFKFTFEGEIKVTLRDLGKKVELAVSDTGTGIPEAELPRLFQRFFRVEGARGRTYEGTGIGLSMVQELVKLHGGDVRVESTAGTGSTFFVTIPRGSSHLPQNQLGVGAIGLSETRSQAYLDEALRWLPDNPQENAPASHERPRILLADDNADMRQYVQRLLSQHYDVEAVTNGAEALRAAQRQPPDLVLSDVMMPELDGFGLLSALRGDDRTRGVPVVLLSARAGEEARVEGLDAGADDYLVKPFGARELLARVRTNIELAKLRQEHYQEQERKQAEDELRASNLQLRRANRELEEFAYVASHDLQEPLRMVNIYTQQLLRGFVSDDPDAKIFAGFVQQGVMRMEELIRDLLRFSRSVHTDGLPASGAADLSASLVEALNTLKNRIEESGARVTAEPLPVVRGDVAQLSLVFQNLLSNSLKYRKTEETPEIHISVKPDGINWVVSVRDNGIGFEQQYAERIFGLFKRLHKNAYPGTGLGLAICHRIVERYGGRMWAEGRPGSGSTFYFALPPADSAIS